MQQWRNYEQVARHLLEQFASDFGLTSVDGKQKVEGGSGTEWEIDAKGVLIDDDSFLIVECKRWSTRVDQATVASLAFQIIDTGASGGILVSPLGFQKGAKKVAAAQRIVEVKFDPRSTYTDYFIRFMEKAFVGLRLKLPRIGVMAVRARATQSVRVEIGSIGVTGVHITKG